ncbi:predicted protein [Nematostella vectensis]|uniref:Battenin n=1 Tax=Nematostella vectensis TaxID=45351 RepID=A7S5Z4_NEMVE|nr:predicted protein [Nematostella vectensis]|eukprot:XP_001632955.1 predicted protein [Nematostella vectensis]
MADLGRNPSPLFYKASDSVDFRVSFSLYSLPWIGIWLLWLFGHVYLAVALPFSVLPTTVPYLFDRIPALVWIGLLFPLNHLGILAVALCRVEWVRLVGVFSLSTAASLSDVTAISLTAHFHKRTVTAYCSGLGFATFFAPMYYTGGPGATGAPGATGGPGGREAPSAAAKVIVSTLGVLPFVFLLSFWLLEDRRNKIQIECYELIPSSSVSAEHKANPTRRRGSEKKLLGSARRARDSTTKPLTSTRRARDSTTKPLTSTRRTRASKKHESAPKSSPNSTEHEASPRCVRDSMEHVVVPRCVRDSTEHEASPRCVRDSMEQEAGPSRVRDSTEHEASPRCVRDSMEQEAGPSRVRDSTEHEASPRCVRDSMEQETGPSRVRDSTEHEASPRCERDSTEHDDSPRCVRDSKEHEADTSSPLPYLSLREKLSTTCGVAPKILQILLGVFCLDFVQSGVISTLAGSDVSLSPVVQYKYFIMVSLWGLSLSRIYLGAAEVCRAGLSDTLIVRKTWIMLIISVMHVIILVMASWYRFLPNFWLILFLAFNVGFFGMAVGPNLNMVIAEIEDTRRRELSMGLASWGIGLGSVLGAVLAMPVETTLRDHCRDITNHSQYCLARVTGFT